MTPSPTSNPDLGELVARLRAVTTLPMLCNQAADAIEALEKERDGLAQDYNELRECHDAKAARADRAEARANSEGSDASAARKRVRELVAQIAALEQSNTVIGEQVQLAEAEVAGLRSRVQAYEAPNGWQVLYARDARRVLGDPSKSVSGSELHSALTQKDRP